MFKELSKAFEHAGYQYMTMKEKAELLRSKLLWLYKTEIGNMSIKELEIELAMQGEKMP